MKTYSFSKFKLLYEFISAVCIFFIINLAIDMVFGGRLNFAIDLIIWNFFVFGFVILAILLLFLFALPTITSIHFDSEWLVIKYVPGHKTKIINFSDIKQIEKSGMGPNNYRLWHNHEKIRLFLQYFNKSDRSEIIKKLHEIVGRI